VSGFMGVHSIETGLRVVLEEHAHANPHGGGAPRFVTDRVGLYLSVTNAAIGPWSDAQSLMERRKCPLRPL